MKKWEYKIEVIGRSIAPALVGTFDLGKIQQCGDEGWEAVGAWYDVADKKPCVLFKREKQ